MKRSNNVVRAAGTRPCNVFITSQSCTTKYFRGYEKKNTKGKKKERKKKRFDISLNQGRGAALRSGWTVFLSEMEGLLRGFVPEKNDHFRQ